MKTPDPPIKWIAREGLRFPALASLLSREKRAKLKARPFPDLDTQRPSANRISARADSPGYRWSCFWLPSQNRIPPGVHSRHRWLSWCYRWSSRNRRWDKWRPWDLSRESSNHPRSKASREERLRQDPRHKRRTLTWQGRKELKDCLADLATA